MYHGIQELPCFEGAAAAFPHTAAAIPVLTPEVAVRVLHEPPPNAHGLSRDTRPQVVPAPLDPGNLGKSRRGQASDRGSMGRQVPRPLLGADAPRPPTRHGPFCRTSWGDAARDGRAAAPEFVRRGFVPFLWCAGRRYTSPGNEDAYDVVAGAGPPRGRPPRPRRDPRLLRPTARQETGRPRRDRRLPQRSDRRGELPVPRLSACF